MSEETVRQGPNIARDCVIYFLWSSGNYGLTFWLPKVLVVAGASNLSTGWWATATFGFGALAMLWASRRRGFRALPFLFLAATMGFVGAALAHSVLAAVASFSLAAIGLLAALPIFWSLASSRLTRQGRGSGHCACQLRWSCWRICRTLCYGMVARRNAPLLSRAVGHRWRHGAGRMPGLQRIRKTAVCRPTSSRLAEREPQTLKAAKSISLDAQPRTSTGKLEFA